MANVQFENIDPQQPAGAQIFESVKLAILRMQLTPGQILSESDIAEQFGASRTPVREALMKLRDVGLVTTQPSRGHFVTLLDENSIREARFLREAIEVASISRLCDRPLLDTTRVRLKANLAEQSDAVRLNDDIKFSLLDDEFHRLIALATGYERVALALEREKVVLNRLRVLTLGDHDHMRRLREEHQEIFDGLLAQDKQCAIKAIRAHVQTVLKTLSSLVSRHADYFEARPASER